MKLPKHIKELIGYVFIGILAIVLIAAAALAFSPEAREDPFNIFVGSVLIVFICIGIFYACKKLLSKPKE